MTETPPTRGSEGAMRVSDLVETLIERHGGDQTPTGAYARSLLRADLYALLRVGDARTTELQAAAEATRRLLPCCSPEYPCFIGRDRKPPYCLTCGVNVRLHDALAAFDSPQETSPAAEFERGWRHWVNLGTGCLPYPAPVHFAAGFSAAAKYAPADAAQAAAEYAEEFDKRTA